MRSELSQIVAWYVGERLREEIRTSARGRSIEIARQTHFTPAHISNVKDGSRNVGSDFAAAIAKYWGMTDAQLVHAALDHAEKKQYRPTLKEIVQPAPAPSESMPMLKATMEWCTGTLYPKEFLEKYEAVARKSGQDRPKEVWLADLQVKFWEYKHSRKQAAKPADAKTKRRKAVDESGTSEAVAPDRSGVQLKEGVEESVPAQLLKNG
jgi:plasmid maintenance system antidote protein VapI